jgi:16S rRNA (uracil1498-N3)-methyltransferase
VHRFFLPPETIRGEEVSIPPEQARQIGSVLRLRPGERILVLDNSGTEYLVRLRSPEEGIVEGRSRNEAEPGLRLVLYQGLLKGPKLEWVLQKGTEIGISRFVPVITERSVAGEPGESKQRRYDAIMREAAEQSGRGRIPDIAPTVSLTHALAGAEGTLVIPWEEERDRALGTVKTTHGDTVSIFIGPEGGFSAREVEAACSAGAIPVTLGRRILRAETAAVVTASLLLGSAGDLG